MDRIAFYIVSIILLGILLYIIITKNNRGNITGGGYTYIPESKILIYCHNKPLMTTPEGNQLLTISELYASHYELEFFNRMISRKDLKKINVETLDVQPLTIQSQIMMPPRVWNNISKYYKHNIADGFDIISPMSFINTHKEIYDIVFVPDCGGEWYNIGELRDEQSRREKYVQLINNILSIVKPNGWLLVSKFLSPGVINLVTSGLKEINIQAEIITGNYSTEWIWIKK